MMKAAPPEPMCSRGAAAIGLPYGQCCVPLDCIWAISIDKPNNPAMTRAGENPFESWLSGLDAPEGAVLTDRIS